MTEVFLYRSKEFKGNVRFPVLKFIFPQVDSFLIHSLLVVCSQHGMFVYVNALSGIYFALFFMLQCLSLEWVHHHVFEQFNGGLVTIRRINPSVNEEPCCHIFPGGK